MKQMLIFLFSLTVMISCNKENCKNPPPPVSHPRMNYQDLNNSVITFNKQKQLDLDEDSYMDLLFSTQLVGDPILKRDRRQYFLNANFHVNLLVSQEEQSPVLAKDDTVRIRDHEGYNWYNGNSIVLAEKVVELSGAEHWEGNWKTAVHKYLPIQIKKNNLRYNGWVELSFDMNAEAMILHRAAICTEAEKDIKAGY